MSDLSSILGEQRTTYARSELFRFGPWPCGNVAVRNHWLGAPVIFLNGNPRVRWWNWNNLSLVRKENPVAYLRAVASLLRPAPDEDIRLGTKFEGGIPPS